MKEVFNFYYSVAANTHSINIIHICLSLVGNSFVEKRRHKEKIRDPNREAKALKR